MLLRGLILAFAPEPNMKPAGFVFFNHVADTQAPKVILIVGSMSNLASDVLQAAAGNHFRDRIQSMPAIRFIETRQGVQHMAARLCPRVSLCSPCAARNYDAGQEATYSRVSPRTRRQQPRH